MQFSNNVLGGYCTELINIRSFKEKNSYTIQKNVKPKRVSDEDRVMERLLSINPNIDVANLSKQMKQCEIRLQKYNYTDIFDTPEALSTRGLLPIYGTINSNLTTLNVPKGNLYQTKRTKLYTQLPSFSSRGNIVPGQTLLITVSMYYPFHWRKDQLSDEAVSPHCKAAVQFYDTQTLHNLKQAFTCDNAYSEISGDISENPHKPFEHITNSDLKHGLFYINNKLYVDSLPDRKTVAHANTMKTWAQNNGHFVQDISTMDAQFLDLEVRIGEPYVYQHLGRCEHLFIFSEISFAQPTDSLGQVNYPRVINMAKEKSKYCIYCSKRIASIVMLRDDVKTPLTVNHMCEPCFLSYDYDHLGNKIGNFKAYRCLKWKK